MNLSPDQWRAVNAIVGLRRTVMLTGDAGSGKTYVTNYCVQQLESRGVRVFRAASTGLAASHINGETAYRVFGIVPTESGPELRSRVPRRVAPGQDALFVIDEISMLRVDVLHAIDARLRLWGDPSAPWGGYQMLFVGDFEQLPPVVRGREAASVRRIGGDASGYAFRHPLWPDVTSIVLTTVHRQADDEQTFKRVLNDVRYGRVSDRSVDWMNRNFKRGPAPRGVIRLCNTRRQAARCNAVLMPKGAVRVFTATATGSYRRDVEQKMWGDLPMPYEVSLIEGSRVMCKANIPGTDIVNGDLGTLLGFVEGACYVQFDRHGPKVVEPQTTNRIEGLRPSETEVDEEGSPAMVPEISGSYEQVPLIPAHAITIHASQGLSLPAAEISMDPAHNFSPSGLLYVALSRVETLSGVYLSYPLKREMFRRSPAVAKESRRILATSRVAR